MFIKKFFLLLNAISNGLSGVHRLFTQPHQAENAIYIAFTLHVVCDGCHRKEFCDDVCASGCRGDGCHGDDCY